VHLTAAGLRERELDGVAQSNQSWTHNSANQITLFSGSSQMCLDDYGWGTTNGTAAAIWTCTGRPNQQWTLNPDGTVTNVYSGLCLDVSNAGTANGTKVHLWTCSGSPNQEWNLG
jgi:hypothetical protein